MSRDQRRLAAIVAADVVGYSRLIGRDESGTLAQLKELRRDLIDPQIAEHGGRIVKTTGDGLLLEFGSVVDAVRCVVTVQREMARRAAAQPAEQRIELRIGIHMGDIVIDGDDILGDGVNVAARLETLAAPGGVCVSGRVQEDLAGKLDLGLEDGGEQLLKNIHRPVRVWRWSPSATAAPAIDTLRTDPVLALPDKPSIAVLPFTNMSGDQEQEYFADGMAEDILTGLSRHRWLFVIARNSSFTYKGSAIDVRQVGRELGVRYVLEGSVRRAGGRVRFTAQLIDTGTGNHLWADRYEGPVEDLFALQDRITEAVVGILEPAIQQAEIERVRRKRPENLDAYDHYLRSLTLTDLFTREAVQGTLDGCLRAIALDPTFAPAYALAGRACIQRLVQGYSIDEAKERAQALALVERGLRADRRDAFMLGTAGHCFAFFAHDLKKGIAYIDEAIGINPNHAHAFLQSGIVRTFAGETRTAIEHLERGLRLSPRDSRSYAYFGALSSAYSRQGDHEAAIDWARRSVQHNPNYLPGWLALAIGAAMTGRDDEARAAVARILALDPAYSMGHRRRLFPFMSNASSSPLGAALRRVGMPE